MVTRVAYQGMLYGNKTHEKAMQKRKWIGNQRQHKEEITLDSKMKVSITAIRQAKGT